MPPVNAPTNESQLEAASSISSQNTSPSFQPSEGPVSLTAEQEQKLRSELDLVRGNLKVMSEMLNELLPGQSQPDDTQLLQQLFSVCKSMQTRVVELIPQLLDEGFIEELLVVNDDLNNAFIRYERFDRLNKAQIANTQQSSSTNLINLSSEPSTVRQPAVISTTSQPAASTRTNQQQSANHNEEEEFDMFAQTRGSSLADQRKSVRYEDPGAVEGLAGALDTRLQVTGGGCTATVRCSWILFGVISLFLILQINKTQGHLISFRFRQRQTLCRMILTNGYLLMCRKSSLQFAREFPVKSLISSWRIGRRRQTTAARRFSMCHLPHPDGHHHLASNGIAHMIICSHSECVNKQDDRMEVNTGVSQTEIWLHSHV
uniref:Target of Myb protein 1-like n=1 Tax=Neolamprologus brichardi TaxID=32507 RepID=A0A3Q4N2M4_NEOBR